MPSIRVPARVLFYMSGTGWAQGGNATDRADVARDPVRQRLIAAMDGPHNADGSITLRDPSGAMLARLYVEADHCAESYRSGDHEPDTLADYNSGTALMRRVSAMADPDLDIRHFARSLMYGEVIR